MAPADAPLPDGLTPIYPTTHAAVPLAFSGVQAGFPSTAAAAPRAGDIVVMQINNEFTVKRFIEKPDGTPYLHPESRLPDFKDIVPSEFEEWICFGVVRHIIKSL